MVTARFDQDLAKRIEEARIAAGLTRTALANATAIPYTTLNRKLDAVGSFSVHELSRISAAIGVTCNSLWPIDEAA